MEFSLATIHWPSLYDTAGFTKLLSAQKGYAKVIALAYLKDDVTSIIPLEPKMKPISILIHI